MQKYNTNWWADACTEGPPQTPREREGASGEWVAFLGFIEGTASTCKRSEQHDSKRERTTRESCTKTRKDDYDTQENVFASKRITACTTCAITVLVAEEGAGTEGAGWGEISWRTDSTKRCVHHPIPRHGRSCHAPSYQSWSQQTYFTGPRVPSAVQSCLCYLVLRVGSIKFSLPFLAAIFVFDSPPSRTCVANAHQIRPVPTLRSNYSVNRIADLCRSELLTAHVTEQTYSRLQQQANVSNKLMSSITPVCLCALS